MGLEIHLSEIQLELAIGQEDGIRRLKLTDDKSGIAICLALPEEGARKLAGGLLGTGLIVPDAPRLVGRNGQSK